MADATKQPEDELDEHSRGGAEKLRSPDSANGHGTHVEAPSTPPNEEGRGEAAEPLSLSVQTTGKELQGPSLAYPIVAVGASAGGLQAFRELLENLDPDTGMAFVLVTHLSPHHKSFLTEIVDRYTRMPVGGAIDGQRPEPNHVYILQPNEVLRMREGLFEVEARDPGSHQMVIDTFMRSLAADQKNYAIGVVLSGADGDGASGLKTIKGGGGLALVQSPASAVQPSMPRSSIAADHVDLVVPPAELALELGRLAYHFAAPGIRSLEEGAVGPDDEKSFQRILQLIRNVSGLELRQYKLETLHRRTARRMLLQRKDNLSEYLRLLQGEPEELRLLQEDLLINVTRFFRDPSFWEVLRDNVLPTLIKGRSEDRPLRIWCAGCSTGEEAYSLAITLIEYLSQNNLDIPLQIFGTDASERSVDMARLAIYPDSLASEISPERIRRFFVKVERGYQVSKRVRDTCIFARQNLCADPPFSHIDILSCRNVMIYFNQVLQGQVLVTFHYALEPGGYMLLGMSEGLREYNEIFNTVDRKHKIYLKTGGAVPRGYELPLNYAFSQSPGFTLSPALQSDASSWPELELQRAADRIVLTRFGPPGLIVDERLHVLQSRGQVGPYVELAPGTVSWNLLRILREGIAAETRSVVQRAIRENIPVTADAVIIDQERGEQNIQIDVLPITSALSRSRCFLILFQSQPAAAPVTQSTVEPSIPQITTDEKDRLASQLRQDLSSVRFHLQCLVEERDARNQELVSANEEIQSANEELQSTNEELETTKEELQSANEELQTVNEELQQRNNVLTQTGNDLTNLLTSVNIPLLMLTSELNVRQFTPPMQRLVSVRAADIGRFIGEIRLQLSIHDITPILQDVLDTLGTRELEVQDREGRWHLLRVRPYRTADNKIEGLVVVLLDIDELRSSRQRLLEAHHFASSVVESVPVPIVVLNQDCSIRTANTAFRNLTEQGARGLEGQLLPELVKHLWGLGDLRERVEPLLTTAGATQAFEHESTTPQKRTLFIRAQALKTEGTQVLLLMMEDITLRRSAEQLTARQNAALQDEVDLAARLLSHTKEELRGLTGHLFTVQEEEREHIARELHDDVSQRLGLIEILLTKIKPEALSLEDREKLNSAQGELQSLNADVRQISHTLHPAILKDLGLPLALKALVDEFGRREGMPANFSTKDLPERLPVHASTAVYRIAQEALHNVAKHAGKTHVKLLLRALNDQLELQIKDFGMGFDRDAEEIGNGLGIISMEERARLAGGTFEVDSELGSGTAVTVRIPIDGVS